MKYREYSTEGQLVLQKLLENKPLTEEDRRVILRVMMDPLQEFVKREAPFRFCDIFGMEDQEVNEETLEKAETVIRDVIDNCESLYDLIDSELRYELSELKEE